MALPFRTVADPACTKNWEHADPRLMPAGAVTMTLATTAPAGWLLAQGQTLNTADYPDLARAMGITASTFTLPDMRGRVPVGLDAGQTEFDAMQETGGTKTHTLSIAEMPSHNHGGATGTPTVPPSAGRFGDWTGVGVQTGWATTMVSGGSNEYTAHTHAITAQGGGGSHNNLQPYLVLNFMVKT